MGHILEPLLRHFAYEASNSGWKKFAAAAISLIVGQARSPRAIQAW